MKSENGINNRWELLEQVLETKNLKRSFSAYGWLKTNGLKMTKEENWSGWWNDYFNFVSVFPTTERGFYIADKIKEVFRKNGYDIHEGLINNGFSIGYSTMSKEEIDEKSKRNLYSGGRMSD